MGDLIGSATHSIKEASEILQVITDQPIQRTVNNQCVFCGNHIELRREQGMHTEDCIVTRANTWFEELSPVFD